MPTCCDGVDVGHFIFQKKNICNIHSTDYSMIFNKLLRISSMINKISQASAGKPGKRDRLLH